MRKILAVPKIGATGNCRLSLTLGSGDGIQPATNLGWIFLAENLPVVGHVGVSSIEFPQSLFHIGHPGLTIVNDPVELVIQMLRKQTHQVAQKPIERPQCPIGIGRTSETLSQTAAGSSASTFPVAMTEGNAKEFARLGLVR